MKIKYYVIVVYLDNLRCFFKNCIITHYMKAATVIQLKKELETLNEDHLKQLCLRLARFKIENKELLTYLLFESEDEAFYIEGIKEQTDQLFEEINTKSYFYIKKSVRKILRLLKKYARYSNSKETEVELLIYYCYKLQTLKPSINNNLTLTNIYLKQIENIEKKIIKLHEDLQFDFREKLEQLNLKH
jgi:hypothetical protein